jgi:glycosyltransferase involved in cell wall biosynthesis
VAAREISVWAISLNYWPIFSGAAVQAQRLYAALVEDGFRCTVLTARHGEAAAEPRTEITDGVRIRRLGVVSPRWSGSRPFGAAWRTLCRLSFALACDLRLLLARRQIDVLHVHGAFLPPIVLFARLLGIPVVVKQTMFEPPARSLGARVQHWALVRADRVITLSRAMSVAYAALAPAKLVMIPQGVDTTLFRPVSEVEKRRLREALRLDPDADLLVFIGAVEHRKGVDILVRAFAEATGRCPHLALIVIGQRNFAGHHEQHVVPERQRYLASLEQDLARHGVQDRVTWTDALPAAKVASYLQAADLFCLPSRREGVPSAVLEAMACSLPVIVSALDGTSTEILTDGSEGFIVDGDDPAAYAARFTALVADRALASRMGLAGRRRVEQEFSFDRAVDRYRRLFRSLACGREAASEIMSHPQE